MRIDKKYKIFQMWKRKITTITVHRLYHVQKKKIQKELQTIEIVYPGQLHIYTRATNIFFHLHIHSNTSISGKITICQAYTEITPVLMKFTI